MVTEKMENERDTVYVLTQEQISQIADSICAEPCTRGSLYCTGING